MFLFQMSLLPSVQPFHAIAYPLDPMLALEIRLGINKIFKCIITDDAILDQMDELFLNAKLSCLQP